MLQNLLIVFFIVCLVCHIYTDVKELLLYDVVSAGMLLVGCIYAYWYGNLWQSLIGAVFVGGIMLLLYILCRGGMGEGDVKLSFVLGVWLGPILGMVCLALAFGFGGILAIFLLLLRCKRGKEMIPFGPFLCLGGAVSLFYGNELIKFYLSYF